MMKSHSHENPNTGAADTADVVLIGGGIMSATLGSMLAVLQPDWRIVMLEKASTIASESSDPWNNAGTGHSGFCELNYMADPHKGSKPASIAEQFQLSRAWWAHLASRRLVNPADFIHSTTHMDLVFGQTDVDYLRERVATLQANPLFADVQYSENPEEIEQWAPLTMEGRVRDGQPIAASRILRGTDIDFGALTKSLTKIIMAGSDNELRLGHEVKGLKETKQGWTISGTASDNGASRPFSIDAKHVFVGAGGFALRLLQKSGIPEVKGYAVLPVGAAFYRSAASAVVKRHDAKVYGQAAVGAPPMSVPHLDKRIIDDEQYVMFGPYATFSTKLLKHGRLSDFFTTLRPDNLHVIAAAGLQNLDLVSFLIKELVASPKKKFAQLKKYYPRARFNEWELVSAGQRAQLVKPDSRRIGVLQQGTELVVSADGSIAGLLGASPGASTAVPIMIGLLKTAFPSQWHRTWRQTLTEAIPDLEREDWTAEAVAKNEDRTAEALGLISARSADQPR